MILADTSGLVALLDRGERSHTRVRRAVEQARGPLLTTDFVLAETDFLILRRLGTKAERAFLDQLTDGAVVREEVSGQDLRRAAEIAATYGDHSIGLTDSVLMAVAERLHPVPVLTLDRRHFTPFRTRAGQALSLLPDE